MHAYLEIGSKAVIVGAGIGGLAAAAALSPLFREVAIVEKDGLPDAAEPRQGIAQGRHVHVFLVGGLESLEAIFPGILADFEADGAVGVDIGEMLEVCDFGRPRRPVRLGMRLACLSRPAYERRLRRRVEALSNVTIRQRRRIDAIAFDDGRATGVETRDESIAADLVVDASGRGAALAGQLVAAGFGAPAEAVIGIDMSYASARMRLAPDPDAPAAALCVPEPPDKRFGALVPIEDGLHLVSLGGRCGTHAPTDPDGFLDYARQLASPTIYRRIAHGTFESAIRRYRKPTATWRRYEAMADFPTRLGPLGDTIASFNPTFGQGMTVAVRQALALREALVKEGLDGFTRPYLDAAAGAARQAWEGAALVDLAHPEVTGPRPPDLQDRLIFMIGLRRLADRDPEARRLEAEVIHMVRPASALHEMEIGERVEALLAAESSRA